MIGFVSFHPLPSAPIAGSRSVFANWTPDARTGGAASTAWDVSGSRGGGTLTITAISSSRIGGTFAVDLAPYGGAASGHRAVNGAFDLPFADGRVC